MNNKYFMQSKQAFIKSGCWLWQQACDFQRGQAIKESLSKAI